MKGRSTLAAAIALSACATSMSAQTPSALAARAVGPLADSLRALALNMADILRRRDTKGTFALYGNLTHFVHVEDGKVASWSQLAKEITQYFESVTSNPLSVIGEPGIVIMDTNNAVVYVVHRLEANEGRASHEGVWTDVLHRFRDGWKIVHSHSSDRRPPS